MQHPRAQWKERTDIFTKRCLHLDLSKFSYGNYQHAMSVKIWWYGINTASLSTALTFHSKSCVKFAPVIYACRILGSCSFSIADGWPCGNIFEIPWINGDLSRWFLFPTVAISLTSRQFFVFNRSMLHLNTILCQIINHWRKTISSTFLTYNFIVSLLNGKAHGSPTSRAYSYTQNAIQIHKFQ